MRVDAERTVPPEIIDRLVRAGALGAQPQAHVPVSLRLADRRRPPAARRGVRRRHGRAPTSATTTSAPRRAPSTAARRTSSPSPARRTTTPRSTRRTGTRWRRRCRWCCSAATAEGIATYWSTPPLNDSPRALEVCKFEPHDRFVGIIYVGYPQPPLPTPERPDDRRQPHHGLSVSEQRLEALVVGLAPRPRPSRTTPPPGSPLPAAADRGRRPRRDSAGRDGCGRAGRDGRRRAPAAATRRRIRLSSPVSSCASRSAASHGVSPGSTCPPGWSQIPSDLCLTSITPADADHDRRAGDVDRIGVLVERTREGVEAVAGTRRCTPARRRRSVAWRPRSVERDHATRPSPRPDDWSRASP